jgi:hypothetical protein
VMIEPKMIIVNLLKEVVSSTIACCKKVHRYFTFFVVILVVRDLQVDFNKIFKYF